jgi:hypothetical protein
MKQNEMNSQKAQELSGQCRNSMLCDHAAGR